MEVFIWFAFCVGIGYYANSKGRSAIAWGLLAFVFSPLLAGIVLALMKDKRVGNDITQLQMEHQQLHDRVASDERMTQMQFQNMQSQISAGSAPDKLTDGEYKICPYCKERIRKDAVVCRFCHQSLTDMLPQAASPAAEQPVQGNVSFCPNCGSSVSPADVFCNSCGAKLRERG